jgi:hypothetical protein
MQRYLSDGVGGQVSPFLRGNGDFDAGSLAYSWVDVFLRDDIHILGLSLDFVEIDLWWLLVFKERLRCRNRLPIGATVYYHSHVGDLSASDRTRLATLEGLGVRVVAREIEGDWAFARAYHSIVADVRRMNRRAPNRRMQQTASGRS